MEELVGKLWHRTITRAARREHPLASVSLASVRRPIALMYRAAGGMSAARFTESALQPVGGARHWLERVAGSGTQAELPCLDEQGLALPTHIAVFNQAALNRDLYFWLAALAGFFTVRDGWIADNLRATRLALEHWPGLRQRHQRLLAQQLGLRPAAPAGSDEWHVQRALRRGATETLSGRVLDIQPSHVAPVWVWWSCTQAPAPLLRDGEYAPEPAGRNPHTGTDMRRRRAEAVTESHDKNGLLMCFRAESVLSWGEFVRVNRHTDDDPNPDAHTAADDMQTLSISTDGRTSASRVKFDLDLPSAASDDLPVSGGCALPEWDWKRQRLLPGHCSAQEWESRPGAPWQPAPSLQRVARRLRRQMEVLGGAPRRLHGEPQGEDIDLDAWIRLCGERRAGSPCHDDARLYTRQAREERSLACLLLADLSMSTDAWAGHARVIDTVRDALYAFGEALSGCGDPFSILGFSSVRRTCIRIQRIKPFDEAWSPRVKSRVGAIRPGYYTRMGAAIRYASLSLQARGEHQRLLLLLTDGKPNDLDAYEGRWGLEDTRMAILEARQCGLLPYCVTIDREAHSYLPYLFGRNGWTLVRQPAELAQRLAGVYASMIRR